MRIIETRDIIQAVSRAVIEANTQLPPDVQEALEQAIQREESPVGREILSRLLENARIAREERIPICQDTGLVVFFVSWGQEVALVGSGLREALEEGVRKGYKEGYLRKSVSDPFTRQNTGDNTPVVIHLESVPGDGFIIWVVPKGGGSENMSRLYMLPPSEGWDGLKRRVVDTVREAGPNPCPPTIVGVGIGGNFEQCALLAKKALLRPIGTPNPDPELRPMEEELLEAVNRTGVGPQGLGGRITSLAVHLMVEPCHIASLPVAVNLQCHASRHVEIRL